MERIIIRRFILGGKGNVGSLHCIVVEIDATERLLDAAQRSGSFARLQLAFPHLDHVPAHTPQLHPVPGITRLIALNLLLPEAGICLRQAEIAAPLMPMPETSVYENHRTVAAKHNVGRARQSAHVLAIAESPGKQIVAHHRFRTRVAAADVRHAAMPLLGCHCVNHTNLSSTLSAQHKCRLYDGKRNHRHQLEPSKTPASSFCGVDLPASDVKVNAPASINVSPPNFISTSP